MLRDFSTVLIDLQQALVQASENSNGMIAVLDAEMKVPIDMRVIFRDGEAVLQGDVPRSIEDANWFNELSSLKIQWHQAILAEENNSDADESYTNESHNSESHTNECFAEEKEANHGI